MRHYTAGSLVRCYRWCRENPDGAVPVGPASWDRLTSPEWLRWFRECLNRKASRGQERTGRKLSWDWQRDARDLAWRMNNRIITRINECLPEYRARLAHRLYGPDDF